MNRQIECIARLRLEQELGRLCARLRTEASSVCSSNSGDAHTRGMFDTLGKVAALLHVLAREPGGSDRTKRHGLV
ncbi:MAG TPA: hypothetical protein VIM81_12810 [Gammaproteobacteria bacterium]